MRRSLMMGLSLAGAVLLGVSCSEKSSEHDAHDAGSASVTPRPFKDVKHAIAVVHSTEGNTARGVVRFTQLGGNAVQVVAEIEGLKPNAKHGFHIHQYGDCSRSDGKSAGGHYDPATVGHHGKPDSEKHHAGDMGNLESDKDGKAHYEKTLKGISIAGTLNPILGRGVIVHASEDVFEQPTGNAGARIGCGVIGVANSK